MEVIPSSDSGKLLRSSRKDLRSLNSTAKNAREGGPCLRKQSPPVSPAFQYLLVRYSTRSRFSKKSFISGWFYNGWLNFLQSDASSSEVSINRNPTRPKRHYGHMIYSKPSEASGVRAAGSVRNTSCRVARRACVAAGRHSADRACRVCRKPGAAVESCPFRREHLHSRISTTRLRRSLH